jgi:hypothetical protein
MINYRKFQQKLAHKYNKNIVFEEGIRDLDNQLLIKCISLLKLRYKHNFLMIYYLMEILETFLIKSINQFIRSM